MVICEREVRVASSVVLVAPNGLWREYMELRRGQFGRYFAGRMILPVRPAETTRHFTRAFKSYRIPIKAK